METERKACTSEMAAPVTKAATTPSHGLPVAWVTEKPMKAPISISPSRPRFCTPDLSVRISPSVA